MNAERTFAVRFVGHDGPPASNVVSARRRTPGWRAGGQVRAVQACPDCGVQLRPLGRCLSCPACGWGACG